MMTPLCSFFSWLARFAATVSVALAMAGCVATAPVAQAGAAGDAPSGDQVLMRISIEGLKYLNSFSLLVRPVKGGEPVKIQGWGMGSSGYWSSYYDEVEKGELVAFSLPAGDYEIYSFVATASAWGGPRAVSPEKNFSFPFHVQAGESSYLGNLLVRFRGDSGVASARVGTVWIDGQRKIDFEPIARDTRSRDFKEMESRFPNLKSDQLKLRVLK
jgi:hypothetical protein